MTRVMLHDGTARSAERSPDATAVVSDEGRLTYAELVTQARALARVLVDRGVRRGDRVALLVHKSPPALIAMHAALEAGAAYVPVDLASPAARAALVLRAAEPRVLVCTREAEPLLQAMLREGSLPDVPRLSVDREWAAPPELGCALEDWRSLPAEPLPGERDPDDLAQLLFTSGSTGVPKGVQITHRMVVAFLDWALPFFGTAADDRISAHPPLHFDLSTFDVYGTLRAGAELHLVPARANLHPAGLARFIRDHELTQWFSVPSTLAYLTSAQVVEQDDFPHLRRVLFCGEVMPTPVLAEWMRRVPHARYTNLYGPTEATIASTYYDVQKPPEDETVPLPIGRACAGERAVVLDEQRQPVAPGVTGELHLGGIGLSPGYWRDEEKTAAAFFPDPARPGERLYRTGDLAFVGEDGDLRFVGRVDSQVKHRGYRIELGEIETALNALPVVRETAVVAVETGGFEGTTLCCAYATDEAGLQVAELRTALRRAVPAYMVPTRWQAYDALPKNANGKIDRRAVREAFAAALQAEETA